MSIYIVSIGGTGSRCVEAIAQLASVGLFGANKIQVVFVDPDVSNGNLTRARETLLLQRKTRDLVFRKDTEHGWMQAEMKSLETWSPFENVVNKSLGGFYNYETYRDDSTNLGGLFDVLYTKGEREAQLDVGFRGRPAIGSAIMSQVRLNTSTEEPWRSLIQELEMDLGQGLQPRIFLCGSIFGGTGASGFPTIGRLLINYLNQSGNRGRVKIGGLLMLPYFQFTVPSEDDRGEIYARPEQFLLNTEAALRYYQSQKIFDTIYLLGDQEPATVKNFSIGKNTQDNDPHFIEFFGGLAAQHFLMTEQTNEVVMLSRKDVQRITWEDIPGRPQVKTQLVNGARFAYLWISNVSPELNDGKTDIKSFQKFAPWFSKYFKPKLLFGGRGGLPDLNDDQQQEQIKQIDEWCQSFLRWLGLIHQSDSGRSVQLFRGNLLMDRSGNLEQAVDNFEKLVIGTDSLIASEQKTVASIKEQLITYENNHVGVVGLANALYELCKP